MGFQDDLRDWFEAKQWKTRWSNPPDLTLTVPPGDYRDRLPIRPEDIAEQYASIVQEGRWTMGLVECWGRRAKRIKSSVHVPCCPSFRFNPFAWRGICFGRTFQECCLFGWDKGRMARLYHALHMGREYTDPFEGLHREGHEHQDEISCFCAFNCMLAIVLGLGVGQVLSLCGNMGVNFSGCYTCHAREKLRRKYKLPPMCGLPPGIDDCCVHTFCAYCASHQELREAVLRGMDGPGISPLDVLPESWKHVEGYEEELEYRRKKLETLRDEGYMFLPFEARMKETPGFMVRQGRNARAAHHERKKSLAGDSDTDSIMSPPSITSPPLAPATQPPMKR